MVAAFQSVAHPSGGFVAQELLGRSRESQKRLLKEYRPEGVFGILEDVGEFFSGQRLKVRSYGLQNIFYGQEVLLYFVPC